MRISCLRPDLFPVCEATLETSFHMLKNKTISYLSHPVITDFSLFQTFNLPARGAHSNGSQPSGVGYKVKFMVLLLIATR